MHPEILRVIKVKGRERAGHVTVCSVGHVHGKITRLLGEILLRIGLALHKRRDSRRDLVVGLLQRLVQTVIAEPAATLGSQLGLRGIAVYRAQADESKYEAERSDDPLSHHVVNTSTITISHLGQAGG